MFLECNEMTAANETSYSLPFICSGKNGAFASFCFEMQFDVHNSFISLAARMDTILLCLCSAVGSWKLILQLTYLSRSCDSKNIWIIFLHVIVISVISV